MYIIEKVMFDRLPEVKELAMWISREKGIPGRGLYKGPEVGHQLCK